ncbi:MAG: hypothetical protein KH279_07180 [Collinsella intestinalis]|nr:hypothetical protein [Collinsella intestinalis]
MGVHLIGVDGELVSIVVLREILKCFAHLEDDFDWVRDRLGHERSYAIDAINLRTELGWELAYTDFAAGLIEIIVWYRDNGPGDSRPRRTLRSGTPSRGSRKLYRTCVGSEFVPLRAPICYEAGLCVFRGSC